MEKVQETKLFSATVENKDWKKALRASSLSDADAANRLGEYEKLFSKYESLKEAYKTFSGVTEMPLLSNQYFNATVASFVRSFAGYFTIERDMAEPTALLWFDDVLGVVDERVVLPNLGPENLDNITNEVEFRDIAVTDAKIDISTGKILIPGSVHGVLVSADGLSKYDIVDDRKGNLMAPAGALVSGSVTYGTGTIQMEVAAGFNGGKYTIVAGVDVPGSPKYGDVANNQMNRFKLDMKNVVVTSQPDMLIGESNLVTMAMGNKSLGQNPQEVLGAKLVELYTKLINQTIVRCVAGAAEGDVYTIDAKAWTSGESRFLDFASRLQAFSAEMVNVDTLLAAKSVKGVEATAYLVGKNAGNWFRQMRTTGEFTEQKGSTYVNDLLGFYHDIPVCRHLAVEDNAIYAVHKTPGGELAPAIFGQYLPLTFSPSIGNYSNPTQLAQGVFYQNGIQSIAPALVQKVMLSI